MAVVGEVSADADKTTSVMVKGDWGIGIPVKAVIPGADVANGPSTDISSGSSTLIANDVAAFGIGVVVVVVPERLISIGAAVIVVVDGNDDADVEVVSDVSDASSSLIPVSLISIFQSPKRQIEFEFKFVFGWASADKKLVEMAEALLTNPSAIVVLCRVA